MALWLAPDDKVLSLTPFWPRPKRSLFFFCSYIILAVSILAIISFPADYSEALAIGILRKINIQTYNQIFSSYEFWQWLQETWLVNVSSDASLEYLNPAFRFGFPGSGAQSFSEKARASVLR